MDALSQLERQRVRDRSGSRERESSDQYFVKRDKGDRPSKRAKKKRNASDI